MLKFWPLLLLQILFVSCFGQFNYRKIPSKYIRSNQNYSQILSNFSSKAKDISSYLPANCKKDGSVDYTDAIQRGINDNEIVVMPNFPIMVESIYLNSNNIIIFQNNSKLIKKPTSNGRYNILTINGIHDVEVYFANLVGDRKSHTGTTGEWGFGIDVRSSYNIKIINPMISNCWGDGIIISRTEHNLQKGRTNLPTRNILIDGANLDNNRRNGISVINGDNISILNSTISNTNGTLPMAGIDIEPDNNLGELKNLMISNLITFNNAKEGIAANLNNFAGPVQKKVNIKILDHIDDGSNYAVSFSLSNPNKRNVNFVDGSIEMVNPTWKNNRVGGMWLPKNTNFNKIKLSIKNAKVYRNGALLGNYLNSISKGKRNVLIQ